jgi:RNA polymerase sigma-70 factor, ECF subfamily
VHSDASTAGATDWGQVLRLYDQLQARVPTSVVALNRAVALAEVEGAAAGLEAVDALAASGLADYHLFHAARADLLARSDRPDEAARAYARALELVANAAERAFLEARLRALDDSGS